MGRHASKQPLTEEQRDLATENVGLVFSALKSLTTNGLSPDERLSACGLALIYAARTFDPKKGIFSAHYFRWAKSILQDDSGKGMIVVPKRLRKTTEFTRVGLADFGAQSLIELEPDDIHDLFKVLTERQQELMHLIYDLGASRTDVAKLWETSLQNVCTIHSNSVKTMQNEVQKRRNKEKS